MENLKTLTDADHAVRHWNAHNEVGAEVILVDDHGYFHETTTRSVAWVLPSGTAVVKVAGRSGGYKLSRIWERDVFNDLPDHLKPSNSGHG